MMRSCATRITIALTLLALSGGVLHAQSADGPAADDQQPAAGQPAVPPPPAAEPAAPDKRAIHGALTAGLQFLNGVTQAWGTSLSGNVSKPYSDTGKLVARASYNYASVTISDSPKITKVQTDRTQVEAGADQTFSTHGVFMVRSMYLRDPVQEIFSRYEELVGVGYRYSDDRVTLALVPGVSLLNENTYLVTDVGWQAGVGFHQGLTLKLNKFWSCEDSVMYRHDLGDTDNSTEVTAALTGQVVKGLGLQVKYEYVRETLVPPGVPPFQQTFQIGLQVKF
jgi:hypothetical protein